MKGNSRRAARHHCQKTIFSSQCKPKRCFTAAGLEVVGTAITAEEVARPRKIRNAPVTGRHGYSSGRSARRYRGGAGAVPDNSTSAASLQPPMTTFIRASAPSLRAFGLADQAIHDGIAHSTRYRGSNKIGLTGGFAPADERRPTPISMKERPMAIRCDIHGVHDEHDDP